VVLALGVLGSIGVPSVLAASITVNSLADVAANDGACTLREAITAANTDTTSGAATGECAAGSGNDVIHFSVSGTITLASALPDITTNTTISGDGVVTVSGASSFRVFNITAGSVILSGLTITAGSAASGGGINNAATLFVGISTISGNTAGNVGGGIHNSGTLTVTNSTIDGNTAGNVSGGIHNGGTLTLANSTISGNTATNNGGGILNAGVLSLTNSTITGNSAGVGGGGLGAQGLDTLVNTIVAGNAAPTGPDVENSIDTLSTSLIGVPSGKTLADILVPGGLADNGGPTRTIALALVAGNPAIDAATASVCAAAPVNAIDQRGRPRPAACDIGAYEAQPPTVAAHANVSVAVSPPAPTVVTYTKPTGTDEQGGVAAVTCLPASGSTFAVGTTTVTCTATDAVGHTGTGTFEVIVSAIAAPSPPAPTLPNSAFSASASPSRGTLPAGALLAGMLLLVSLMTLAAVNRRTAGRRR